MHFARKIIGLMNVNRDSGIIGSCAEIPVIELQPSRISSLLCKKVNFALVSTH